MVLLSLRVLSLAERRRDSCATVCVSVFCLEQNLKGKRKCSNRYHATEKEAYAIIMSNILGKNFSS